MAKIRKAALAAYRKALDRACSKAGETARSALLRWLSENPGASVAECRDAAMAIAAGALDGGTAASSALACDLFDAVMDAEGVAVPAAQVAGGVRGDAVEATVRRQAGRLVDGDVLGFADAVAQLAEREVRLAANRTVEENVERAARTRAGRNVRFARVPTSAVPCEWCAMLASRGFVYRSAESAEAASHHHCSCTIVPGVKDSTRVDGYDPAHYKDVWQHRERYEGDADAGADTRTPAPQELRDEAERILTSYGYPVFFGGEEAEWVLSMRGAQAATVFEYDESGFVGCNAYFSEHPTRSEIYEELYHVEQARRGDYFDAEHGALEMAYRREIDAQRYLIDSADRLNIPSDETAQTRATLSYYEEQLERLLSGG